MSLPGSISDEYLFLDQDLIKSNVDRLLQDLSEFLGIELNITTLYPKHG